MRMIMIVITMIKITVMILFYCSSDERETHLFQFILEGMEESGSEGLDDLVFRLKDTFLKVCQSFPSSYQRFG